MNNIIKDIFRRIRKRDFSGNTGLVIKNSIYQFSTNLVTKIGSLIFVIILARMLMPELFGLYSLALSTILIFVAFSELGIGQTLIRFVSKEFGKNKNPKFYVVYLAKLKLFLIKYINLIKKNPLHLVWIVAVILLVFIGFSLRETTKDIVESYEVESFIQAFLQYTTDCRDKTNDILTIRELILECNDLEKCSDERDTCIVLKSIKPSSTSRTVSNMESSSLVITKTTATVKDPIPDIFHSSS